MLLTIIITAYNAEKTISETIESINIHDVNETELLIINDGSTDKTIDILDKYQNMNNIRIISTKNQGVSQARNEGIEYSSGKYIWFVDADDRIPKNAVKTILSLLKDIKMDILMGNYRLLDKHGLHDVEIFSDKQYYGDKKEIERVLVDMLRKGQFEGAVWKNIYNKDFICNNRIFFNKDLFMNEDGNWLFEVLLKAKTMLTIPDYIYEYNNISNTSITGKKQSLASYECSNYVYARWYKEIELFTNDSELLRCFKGRMSNGYASSSAGIISLPKRDKQKAIELYKRNIETLKQSDNYYGKILKCHSIFGYKITLFVSNIAYRTMRIIRK